MACAPSPAPAGRRSRRSSRSRCRRGSAQRPARPTKPTCPANGAPDSAGRGIMWVTQSPGRQLPPPPAPKEATKRYKKRRVPQLDSTGRGAIFPSPTLSLTIMPTVPPPTPGLMNKKNAGYSYYNGAALHKSQILTHHDNETNTPKLTTPPIKPLD